MALLGESFNDYVQSQILVRQDKLSNQNRDNDLLAYLTSKTSFLRLTSGVNVSEEIAKSINEPELKGNLLAKKYVLFSSRFDDKFTSGVGYNQGSFDTSYGFASDPEYGLVPPPGIISATVNTLNKGTIREATINLVCHNIYQFKAINVLFLKLKYSLLLEWGHTLYFNNNQTPTLSTPINLNLSDAFIKGISSDDILEKIEEKRKVSCGNYDAFFGVVKNFNWELQENGSYNVTVIAISQGSIISSLKVNSNIAPDVSIGGNEPQFQKSTIHKILGEITKKIAEGPGGQNGTYKGYLHGYKGADGEIALNTANISNFTGVKYGHRDPRDTDSVGGANSMLTHNEGTAITFPSLQLDGSAGGTSTPVSQYYLKLGALLRIIEAFTLYYDTDISIKTGYAPVFYIDHNFNNNECLTFPRHISTDPLTCIIPPDYTNAAQINNSIYSTYTQTTKTYSVTFVKDPSGIIIVGGTDPTSIATTGFKAPSNPNILNQELIIASSNLSIRSGLEFSAGIETYRAIFGFTGTQETVYITTQTINEVTEATINNESQAGNLTYIEKSFRTGNKYIGKTMHIYVNINKIIEVLDRNIDDDGNISIYTFLTSLLSDLKYALGSVNNFDINYDSSNNRFYIIDSAVLPFKYEKNTGIAKFNINLLKDSSAGGGSFVTNFGLKSEVFAKVANAIALGAQGNGNTMISNSTPLSNFNTGLTDRSMRNKQNPNLTNAKEDEGFDQFGAAYNAYEDYKRKVATPNPEEGLTPDDIATYRSYLVDLFNYDLGTYANNGQIPGTGFIPINLQLTMDGLSGIKQYQAFTVDETLLPSEYKDRLSFITTTISHKIGINGWETTLNSLSIPKKFKKEKKVNSKPPPPPPPPTQTQTTQIVEVPNRRSGNLKTQENYRIKRSPRTITLHYTEDGGLGSAVGTVEFLMSWNHPKGHWWGGKVGIHYAIDRKGNVAKGVDEDRLCIHGDNWNKFGIGIELASMGKMTPKSRNWESRVDLGFTYHKYQYYEEYTDIQISALENLIRSIHSRWPETAKNIQGNNLWEWVFGFHRNTLGPDSRPIIGKNYESLTAGDSDEDDSEYFYTLKEMRGPGGYLGPRGWKTGGFNTVGGLYSHATGGGSHYDIAPTPKIVAMLVRLGYKDGY
jgi:hypothetical protein